MTISKELLDELLSGVERPEDLLGDKGLMKELKVRLMERERRMIERRIKAAKFPAVKSLPSQACCACPAGQRISFDCKAIPALNKMQVLELARCEWIDRRENVIALGPSGTGKTHVALGLGLAVCQKGLSVGFTTAAALVHELIEAVDERRLQRLQKQLVSQDLLIIDELGFVPLSKTGAELLFKRSSRSATNVAPSSSHPTCRSMNGPRSSAQNASQAPFSIA